MAQTTCRRSLHHPLAWLRPSLFMRLFLLLAPLLRLVTALMPLAPARLSCDPTSSTAGDSFCRQILQDGSLCDPRTMRCTSPYASRQGCFGLLDDDHPRVCNSQDFGNEHCTSTSHYPQVTIHAGNWDSSLALAWIYQIILSERLYVPVAVVVGSSSQNETNWNNFYHPAAPIADYDDDDHVPYDWEAMRHNQVHLFPEVWMNSEWDRYQDAIRNGTIVQDPLGTATGIWGQTQWYVPTHTAKRHPDLLHYFGLEQASPQQLAHVFRQPYTWDEYCRQVSMTFCEDPEEVARRAPSSTAEGSSYYVPRLYTGYFGVPEEEGGVFIAPHDNSNHSMMITDDDVDVWQTNNISLHAITRYDRDSITQIWKATNATKSHVVMAWWTPDSFIEAFRDEFQAVSMPQPTCSNQQQQPEPPVCQEAAGHGHELLKAISTSLVAARDESGSPAYDVIRNFRIREHDLQALLKQWGTTEAEDPTMRGFHNRKAVCEFVKEHWDEWEPFVVPKGYPHVFATSSNNNDWTNSQSYLLLAAQIVGGVASLTVLVMGILTVRYRSRLALVYAQIHFVWQVLLGFWLITMAAVVMVKEPSDGRCLLGQWLQTVGITLVHIPLLIKICNMNRIAAQSLQKYSSSATTTARNNSNNNNTVFVIRIATSKLFMVELALTICVVMYLMVWTAYDPPVRTETRVLQEQDDGSSLVETSIQCASQSQLWEIATLCWQALVLTCASVLAAVLSRQVVDKFQETYTSLAFLVYTQDVCLLAQIVLFFLAAYGSAPSPMVSASLSFVLSSTALLSCAIYFGPLFWQIARGPQVGALDPRETMVAVELSLAEQTQTDNDNNNDNRSARSNANGSLHSQQQQQQQQHHLSLAMGSASSCDINSMIQSRLREFHDAEFPVLSPSAADPGGGPPQHVPEPPITAECQISQELRMDASASIHLTPG